MKRKIALIMTTLINTKNLFLLKTLPKVFKNDINSLQKYIKINESVI